MDGTLGFVSRDFGIEVRREGVERMKVLRIGVDETKVKRLVGGSKLLEDLRKKEVKIEFTR